MNRIALVEDHARLAAYVRDALTAAGIGVDLFSDLGSAWFALQRSRYSVVVIDRGLPDGDGLELVKRLRTHGQTTPCLLLTARDALHDRVDGLESGADDYLTKPFPMEELVARVRALLRRPSVLRSLSPAYGDLQLHADRGRLSCGDEEVTLAIAETQIMLALIEGGGDTVRRTALENAAWGLTAVTPNALDVALHRLRRKLQAIGSQLQIVNVRAHGYALRSDTVVAT